MTSEQFAQMCRDICPRCNAGSVARQREDTKEFVHDASDIAKGTLTHMICFATHYRNKYKDSVVG